MQPRSDVPGVLTHDLGRAASRGEPAPLALRGRSSHFITDLRRVYTDQARPMVVSYMWRTSHRRYAPGGSNHGQGMQNLPAAESAARQLLSALRTTAGRTRLVLVGGTLGTSLEGRGYVAVPDVRAAGLAVPAFQVSPRLTRSRMRSSERHPEGVFLNSIPDPLTYLVAAYDLRGSGLRGSGPVNAEQRGQI